MLIKSIVIQGIEGDVRIEASEWGAKVYCGNKFISEFNRKDRDEELREAAIAAAKAIYGIAKTSRFGPGGGPDCANSDVYSIRLEIERISRR